MYRDDRGPLQLGRRLGQGGEGTVFELGGEAVKIYTTQPNADRTQKIRALLSVRTATLEAVSAWPSRLVYDGRSPVGYVMPKIENHYPIGRISLPASRKAAFPEKPWGWLIHVARNLCVAVDKIHRAGVVIGDLNDANILVSSSALVRVLDVDSFQITHNGKSWNTGVGVPMYLPPELQGRDLRSVRRTEDHDAFSLAVLVFQLTMMGRHPWGGDYKNDKSLDELIASEPFAYGVAARARGMRPPRSAPKLEWLQPEMATAFERAFSRTQRPSAHEWASTLDAFKAALTICSVSKTHEYLPAQGGCPWCALEGQSAIFYFVPSSFIFGSDTSSFAIGLHEKNLQALELPENFFRLTPKTSPVRESSRPPWLTRYIMATRMMFLALAALIVFATLSYGSRGLTATALLFFVSYILLAPATVAAREKRRAQTELAHLNQTWDALLAEWHAAGASAIIELYDSTKRDIASYKTLGKLELEENQKLGRHHREILLDLHLATFIIRDAKIGLPKKAIQSLEACGIQTAADIKALDTLKVPKIGGARLRTLRDWRDSRIANFTYNPQTKLPTWMTDDVTSRFDKQRRDLEGRIPKQIGRLKFMIDRWDQQKAAKESAIRLQARKIVDCRSTIAMWSAVSAL